MGDIRSFIGREDRVKKLEQLSVGKTKEERRELERLMLKPEELPVFTGERPVTSSVEARTVLIIFPNDEDLSLFKQFFKVSNYRGQNTRDVGQIIALCEAFERGTLRYNETTKNLEMITDQDESITL